MNCRLAWLLNFRNSVVGIMFPISGHIDGHKHLPSPPPPPKKLRVSHSVFSKVPTVKINDDNNNNNNNNNNEPLARGNSIMCIIKSIMCIINSIMCTINSIVCIINSIMCTINSIMCTINYNHRIAAILYTVETCFISGFQVYNCNLHKTDDGDNNNNNTTV